MIVGTIGQYGCYMLSLLQLGEVRLDDEYEKTLKMYYRMFTDKEWMRHDCYIVDGCAILTHLCGRPFKVTRIDKGDSNEIDAELAKLKGPLFLVRRYRAFSGDGFHFRTLKCDTEAERNRKIVGCMAYQWR